MNRTPRDLASAANALEAAQSVDVTHLPDVAALAFLLHAMIHGPDGAVAYSQSFGGNGIGGPFVAVRASRNGVQRRTA